MEYLELEKLKIWNKILLTVALCRATDVIVPISALVPNFSSLYEIRSIENNLAKHNSIFEIDMKQWNSFAKNDKSLQELPKILVYDNLTTLLQLFEAFRKNRNIKNLFPIYMMRNIGY